MNDRVTCFDPQAASFDRTMTVILWPLFPCLYINVLYKRTIMLFLLSVLLMILHQHWYQQVIVDNDLTFVKLRCPRLGHKVSMSYHHEITLLSKLSSTVVSWMNWIWVKYLVGSFSNVICSIINSYTYSIISCYSIAGAYLAPHPHTYIWGWLLESLVGFPSFL